MWFILFAACCQYNVAHLVYTSTYNVVFGGQVIRNGDESLPYLPLYKVYSSCCSMWKQFIYRFYMSPHSKQFTCKKLIALGNGYWANKVLCFSLDSTQENIYRCFLLSVYKHISATFFSQKVCGGKNRIVNSGEPFQIILGMFVYLILFSFLAIRPNELYMHKSKFPLQLLCYTWD